VTKVTTRHFQTPVATPLVFWNTLILCLMYLTKCYRWTLLYKVALINLHNFIFLYSLLFHFPDHFISQVLLLLPVDQEKQLQMDNIFMNNNTESLPTVDSLGQVLLYSVYKMLWNSQNNYTVGLSFSLFIIKLFLMKFLQKYLYNFTSLQMFERIRGGD
jgi:hypothetical protein